MRRWRWLTTVAVLLAGASACTERGDDGPQTTVPTAASTSSTSTTAAPDIATIPEVIDEAYLNRVLAALDKVDTDAVRVIQQTKRVPPEAAEILNSIYSDDWFTVKVDSWLSQLQQDPDLSGLRTPLGDRRTTVERVIAVSRTCVWMAVRRDYTQSDAQPKPPRTEYLALQPLDRSNDPKRRNPTAWMITTDGFRQDGAEPTNPCPAA